MVHLAQTLVGLRARSAALRGGKRNGGGGEFSFGREHEGKEKSHSAGQKEGLRSTAECRGISKEDLAEGNAEVEADIGWKGMGGTVRRLSRGIWELCAPELL